MIIYWRYIFYLFSVDPDIDDKQVVFFGHIFLKTDKIYHDVVIIDG